MTDLSPYLGIPYVEGRDDCYGLLRRYYRDEFGIELTNYARPGDFAYAGLDLIYSYFLDEGFKTVDVSLNRLNRGDVLLMRVGNRCPTVNHVGICTVPGRVLHHVVDSPSVEEVLSVTWKRRVMTVVRHPIVTEFYETQPPAEVIQLIDLLPPHVRHQFEPEAS